MKCFLIQFLTLITKKMIPVRMDAYSYMLVVYFQLNFFKIKEPMLLHVSRTTDVQDYFITRNSETN